MKNRMAVLTATFLLTACSSGPSKSWVKNFISANHTGADVKVNDLRCTAHENEEYHCFVAYVVDYGDRGKMDMRAEDAVFRKVNGEWETNLKGASHYSWATP